MNEIIKLGQISVPGSQAGSVYDPRGAHQQSVPDVTDTQSDISLSKYRMNNRICYCIDANYWKGTTFETYLNKHKRQLVIEEYG